MNKKIFNTSSPAIFDSNKIEIDNDRFKLKLVDNPGNDFEEDFIDDTGFGYDNTKANFIGGNVRQTDKRPANAIFYAKFNDDENGNWGEGILTGSLLNGAVISGNKLDVSASPNASCLLTGDNNLSGSEGCVRFKITFNDTATGYVLSSNGVDQIYIFRSSINALRVTIKNDASGVALDYTAGATVLTTGVEFEIEINWSESVGFGNIFIDGDLIIQDNSFVGTRSIIPTTLHVGAYSSSSAGANCLIRDLLIFDSVQHTTDYTPDWSDIYETIYLSSKVIFPEMIYTGAGTFIAVTNFLTTFAGSPRLTIEIGRSGDELYWDGVAWCISNDTYTQSTDPSTFAINASTLPVNGEIYGQFNIYFTDTNILSSFSDLIITLTGQSYPTDNPSITFTEIIQMKTLLGFLQNAIITGSDNIKSILPQNTIKKWYNSGWINSDGTYLQSNTDTEIETNKNDFVIVATEVTLIVFLHSDGQTTPELESISIDYDFANLPVCAEKTTIYENYRDGKCNPIADRNIIARLSKGANQTTPNVQVAEKTVYITINPDGTWRDSLINNEDMEPDSYWNLKFPDNREHNKIINKSNDPVEFNDITDWEG